MFKVIAGVTLCLGIAATAAAQDAKVALGEKVYTEQRCAVCHSIAGKGNKKGPLEGVGSRLKAEEVREWMVDAKAMTVKTKSPRKPEMRSYKLPPEELDALVAYMMTLKKS